METKSIKKTTFILTILINLFGCAVENSSDTVGAFNCKPTDTDVSNFQTNVFTQVYLNQNCLTCHGSSVEYAQYKTRFKIHSVDPTAIDQKNNLCISYSLGQKSTNKTLITHPMSEYHGGNRYSSTQIQNLIDWVNNYVLPQ